jgi:uncharacterized RDD family membrane protein YckC
MACLLNADSSYFYFSNRSTMYSKDEGTYGTYGNMNDQKDLLSDDLTQFGQLEYAGFWLRFAAYIIDAIIVWIVLTIFFITFGAGTMFLQDPENLGAAFWGPFGLLYIAIFLYFPLMESSKWQATLGKRAVGIIVTDLNGSRLSFSRALGRTLGKILSGIIIYIGFIMVGFTEKKQGLHDILANALVVKGTRV